jgi:hypothetical protein
MKPGKQGERIMNGRKKMLLAGVQIEELRSKEMFI